MNFLEKVKFLQNYYNAGNFLKVIEGCKVLDKKFPKKLIRIKFIRDGLSGA